MKARNAMMMGLGIGALGAAAAYAGSKMNKNGKMTSMMDKFMP